MQDADGNFWTTDPTLFAALPGGQVVIDWFGFAPSFHDSKLAGVNIGRGSATLTIEAFRMTDKKDAKGYLILDRNALVAIDLTGVSGLSLSGNADTGIFELGIRRLTIAPPPWPNCEGPKADDYELAIESGGYGLEGSLFARSISLRLAPAAA